MVRVSRIKTHRESARLDAHLVGGILVRKVTQKEIFFLVQLDPEAEEEKQKPHEGDQQAREIANYVVEIPPAPELLAPILEIVPLQMLAYHIAVRRGCDVDQPRNLAKSVTVE